MSRMAFRQEHDNMDLSQRLAHTLSAIRQAETVCGRPAGSVRLLAVSKTFPADDIRALYRQGQLAFGENYIQEWQQKSSTLTADCPDIEWHIIGQVQSNKSRAVAEGAHWLHTLDRSKLADRLNAQRPPHLPPLQVLIEVNISGEAAKHGIDPAALPALAQHVAALPNLCLRGLMCVAADTDETEVRRQFARMRQLLAELQTGHPQADTLSMGMSGDMESAIAEGSTLVRIGSSLFGKREKAA